jgi:hypothetical protein
VDNSILTIWDEIRHLIESIDLDVRKNAAGNASAGVRARKGLRTLKSRAAALTKVTVETEKSRKAEKAE